MCLIPWPGRGCWTHPQSRRRLSDPSPRDGASRAEASGPQWPRQPPLPSRAASTPLLRPLELAFVTCPGTAPGRLQGATSLAHALCSGGALSPPVLGPGRLVLAPAPHSPDPRPCRVGRRPFLSAAACVRVEAVPVKFRGPHHPLPALHPTVPRPRPTFPSSPTPNASYRAPHIPGAHGASEQDFRAVCGATETRPRALVGGGRPPLPG